VLPYAFGAVAKLNSDWCFRAQPLRLWVAARLPGLAAGRAPLLAAWARLVFDALMAPALLWPPTRFSVAFPASLLFHLNQRVMCALSARDATVADVAPPG